MSSRTVDSAPPPARAAAVRDVVRVFVLVGVVTGWNYVSDVLAEHLGVETAGFASPWKIPLILVGTLLTCGGVIGLGSVVWGRRSLRELGWICPDAGRLVLIGLLQTALFGAMIVAVYGIVGGLDGLRELGSSLASLSVGQRVFFAVMGAKIAFVEETLFRGDLLRTLAPRIGAAGALIVSSVAFALHHRTLEPIPLVMKLAMGLLFALSATRTRSLVPSALAHALTWAIFCDS